MANKKASRETCFFAMKYRKMSSLSFILRFNVGCRTLHSFGNTPSIAVCENSERDRHDASAWTFVIAGLFKREVESQCSQIEEKIEHSIDSRVMSVVREFI